MNTRNSRKMFEKIIKNQIDELENKGVSFKKVRNMFIFPKPIVPIQIKIKCKCCKLGNSYKIFRKIYPIKYNNIKQKLRLYKKIKIRASGGRDFNREIVRMRDGYTCQLCKTKWIEGHRRFDVHHIDEVMDGKSHEKGITAYDSENMDKLITLCHRCHMGISMEQNEICRIIAYNVSRGIDKLSTGTTCNL